MNRKIFTGLATAAVVTTVAVPVTNTFSSLIKQPVTYRAQAALSASQNAFLTSAIPQAQAAAYKYGVYPSVMLAQAIIESGWGQSALAQSPNNSLFGIKGSYNGQSVNMPTTEYNSQGQAYQTNAQFRKYPNYQASFEDNGALLRHGISGNPQYYINTWLENANSYQNATAGLQGRYATAPNYAASLNAVIAAYGLNKYDPQISWQNTSATVKRNATIYNWPTAPSVATAIGSVRAGQRVQVSEFITNYDGSRFAKVNGGWVDANALGYANKPINNGNNNQQPTKPTNNNGVVVTSGAVQINYVPNYSIAVWTAPGGHTTGETLKHGTTWKITGYKTYNGAKWYRVGKNQWIPAQYTAAPGTVKMPDIIPKHETTPDYIKESGVAQIHYVSGYGIAVWRAPGHGATDRYLTDGTAWKTFGYKYVGGQKWLNVGKDQWIPAQYTGSYDPSYGHQKKAEHHASMSKRSGVVEANYEDGVAVWRQAGAGVTSRYLDTGSRWKFFGTKTVNGETWYNLGGSQWVPDCYVLEVR